jgi:hypothetical protein
MRGQVSLVYDGDALGLGSVSCEPFHSAWSVIPAAHTFPLGCRLTRLRSTTDDPLNRTV